MDLKQGSTFEEIKEALLFTCAYLGFNKAAGAFGKPKEICLCTYVVNENLVYSFFTHTKLQFFKLCPALTTTNYQQTSRGRVSSQKIWEIS